MESDRETSSRASESAETEASEASRIELPPIGVPNPNESCWLITLMQFILNTPSLEEAILNAPEVPGDFEPFREFVRLYREDQRAGTRLFTRVPIQRIREVLHRLNPTYIPLQGAGDFQFALYVVSLYLPQTCPFFCYGGRNRDQLNPRWRELIYFRNFQRLGFDGAILDNFNDHPEHPNRLLESPNELMISVLRHEGAQISVEPIPIHGEFHLPSSVTYDGSSSRYECDFFARWRNAHYLCYEKRNGIWYESDDDRVVQLNRAQAEDAMQRSLFFHYKKID